MIFNNKHFHKVANDDESRDLKPREGSDIDRGGSYFNFFTFNIIIVNLISECYGSCTIIAFLKAHVFIGAPQQSHVIAHKLLMCLSRIN